MTLRPHSELVETLRERLAGPLPGLEAQLTMCPPQRGDAGQWDEAQQRARRAAVLALLYPFDGTTAVVLTQRHADLRAHSGQISFPGGSIDGDETPTEAALREGWEEVGVSPDQPNVLGTMTDLYIPPSDFTVTPIVAAINERPVFRPQEEEVDVIIEVPLPALLDPASRTSGLWTIGRREIEIPYFAFGEFEIWGATAMMLAELLAVIKAA
ncbi:MAG: CoA pyrophosphatase [Rhodothermaceae bacterium]|nr:CoA pyrophosphatase [Rhodothermaceae bacterium]